MYSIQFLRDEMYSLTGVQNDVKLYTLLFATAAVLVQIERDDTDKNQMFVAIFWNDMDFSEHVTSPPPPV